MKRNTEKQPHKPPTVVWRILDANANDIGEEVLNRNLESSQVPIFATDSKAFDVGDVLRNTLTCPIKYVSRVSALHSYSSIMISISHPITILRTSWKRCDYVECIANWFCCTFHSLIIMATFANTSRSTFETNCGKLCTYDIWKR